MRLLQLLVAGLWMIATISKHTKKYAIQKNCSGESVVGMFDVGIVHIWLICFFSRARMSGAMSETDSSTRWAAAWSVGAFCNANRKYVTRLFLFSSKLIVVLFVWFASTHFGHVPPLSALPTSSRAAIRSRVSKTPMLFVSRTCSTPQAWPSIQHGYNYCRRRCAISIFRAIKMFQRTHACGTFQGTFLTESVVSKGIQGFHSCRDKFPATSSDIRTRLSVYTLNWWCFYGR